MKETNDEAFIRMMKELGVTFVDCENNDIDELNSTNKNDEEIEDG